MRYYAFVLTSNNTVGLIQGFGDDAVVETSPDAYVVEITEGQCQEGDVYDAATGTFATPIITDTNTNQLQG